MMVAPRLRRRRSARPGIVLCEMVEELTATAAALVLSQRLADDEE